MAMLVGIYHISRKVILYYAMLCYTMLYYTMLYYTILCYDMIYYATQSSSAGQDMVPHLLATRD
jgi:hypothetical protein